MNPLPLTPLPSRGISPGKAILFGEHAVVYGEPAVVLSLDIYTTVEVHEATGGTDHRFQGDSGAWRRNPYLQEILGKGSSPPAGHLDVRVRSQIPPASGLGSSAALVAPLTAILRAREGPVDRGTLARESFLAERAAQGVGSPVDTTAVTAGGIVAVGPPGREGEELWTIPAVEGRGPWTVRRVPDPGWTWVVGYTGVPKQTGRTVNRVRQRLQETDGPELLAAFGSLARTGEDALRRGDRDAVGQCMERNHALLVRLGVGHPRLDQLVRAVRPHVAGVKITGAGSGGSILALPRPGSELAAARAIARAGGLAFRVRPPPQGVRVEPLPR